ncbi:hypothetical protein AYO47_06645 [Planctomyces sp. SCGC AG-212-M04]|nr:hypothetical protein AYO47_06645 [Planctomyces sp. SCGC AG-212-M04]
MVVNSRTMTDEDGTSRSWTSRRAAEANIARNVMLPALGYTLPTHATDCLKDGAVEAADFVPSQFSDATQLSAITSQHPFGVVNIYLGTLPAQTRSKDTATGAVSSSSISHE